LLLLAIAAIEALPLLGLTMLLATCLLNPVYVHAAATVNNDAAGVAAGALAFLVADISRRTSRRMIAVGVATGFLLGMLKGFFVVAPVVLVLASFTTERPWRAIWQSKCSIIRRNACVLGMVASGGLAYVAWAVLQNARAELSPSIVLDALLGFSHTDYLAIGTILDGLKNQASLLTPYIPDAPVHYLWNLTFFAVVIGVVTVRTRSDVSSETRALAIASLWGMLAIAIAWPLVTYVQGHYNFSANVRYGLPLLPLLSMVAIRSVRQFGMVVLGIVLPASAVISQLVSNRF
jgi:hypothetical protein